MTVVLTHHMLKNTRIDALRRTKEREAMIVEAYVKTQWLVSPWGMSCEEEVRTWRGSKGGDGDVVGYVVRMAGEMARLGFVEEAMETRKSAFTIQMLSILQDQWTMVRLPDPHHEILLRAMEIAKWSDDVEFLGALIRICRTVVIWGRWPATSFEAFDSTEDGEILDFYKSTGRGREAVKALIDSMKRKPSRERMELHGLLERLSDQTIQEILAAVRDEPKDCHDTQDGGDE